MYRSFHPQRDGRDDELDAVDSLVYNGGSYGSQPRVRKNFPETWIWDLTAAG